jgi:anion-transporting  ArsA/GET3 family ATPase
MRRRLVRLSRQLRGLQQVLADPDRTRLFVVTRAEALPTRESREFIAALDRLGIAVGGIVVNALGRGTCTRCRAIARAGCRDASARGGAGELRYHRGPCRSTPAARPPCARSLGRELASGEVTARAATAVYVYCVVRATKRPAVARVPGGVHGATRPEAHAIGRSLWILTATVPLQLYGPARLASRLQDLEWLSRRRLPTKRSSSTSRRPVTPP